MSEEITRKKAIQLKCLDCCCGQRVEIRKCPMLNCPLYLFCMGNEKKAKDLIAKMEQQK